MKAQEPTHILANHQGTSPSDNYADWPKIIEIELKKEEHRVDVRVTMSDTGVNPNIVGTENRRIYWSTMVEELWSHLGIDIGRIEKQRLIQPEFFLIDAKKKLSSSYGGILIFAIGAYFLFYPPFGVPYHGSGLIAAVAGIILMLVQIFRQRKSRKRFRELYPDIHQMPDQKIWIFLISLLLLMPTALGILYFGNFGLSTTKSMDIYSGFGFSMEFPSGIEFTSKNIRDGSEATNMQGMITGEIHRGVNQIELIIVIWRMETVPDEESMKESLDWDFEVLDPIENSFAGPYYLFFRTMEMKVNNKRLYSLGGTWYCVEQQRQYWLIYCNTHLITNEVFFTILESFEYTPLTRSS